MNERVRITGAVLLVVLVVLAGCTGGTGDGAKTTISTTDRATTVTDGTTTEGTTVDTTERSESHPLADKPLGHGHTEVLKKAENFTIRTNVTLRSTGEETVHFRNTTTYVDFASGAVLTRTNKLSPASETTYVAPNGNQYQRIKQFEDSSPEYRHPPIKRNVSEFRNSEPSWFDTAYNLSYEGETTLDNEQVHLYTVTSPEQMVNQSATIPRYEPENVTDIDIRAYVTDEGLIRKVTYHLEYDYEGEHATMKMKFEYTELGATEVESPSWLSEAKEQATTRTTIPDPGREVTETVRDESLGAAVTVTGPKYDVDYVQIERQTGGIWDTGEGGYRNAQVSPLIELWLPSSSEVNVTKMELSYNESAVPDGDETGIGLYRYNRTVQTFVEVKSTIDTEANVVRAEIDREGTYLVMHTETWREYLQS